MLTIMVGGLMIVIDALKNIKLEIEKKTKFFYS